MATTDQNARAKLRARQGKGARYDAPGAPSADLLIARRGTAFFARKLMELTDSDLYKNSAITGLTRAHIVADVSYAARSHAVIFDTLLENETSPPDSLPTIDSAASLPAHALRHLFKHTEVHLNICWRDLTSRQWDKSVTLPDGKVVLARFMPIIRAQFIWQSAINLGNGAMSKDLPEQILQA